MKRYLIEILGAFTLLVVLNSGLAAQSPSDDSNTDATKTGAIRGRVVNESGQPLANAGVFVRAFGSAGRGRSTITDGEGSFEVNDLDPTAYLVSASLPAYTTAPRDPDNTQATYYRIGDSVKLELIKGGVITGVVTTSAGEPVVAAPVRAYMLRDGNGQPSRYGMPFRERATDDRGAYRIYGLAAGTYLVSAGGGANIWGFTLNAYDNDTPTYAPSSARDTAMEGTVRAGEETNVDIRYRGEQGHLISGIANGPGSDASAFNIILSSISHGVSQWNLSSFQPARGRGFAFCGVADGDYDLTAQSFFPGGEVAVSEPRRIKVKGADLTDIALTTKPLGSIVGRVALEESKAPECKGKRRPLFAETLVTPWHNEKNAPKDQPQFIWSMGGPTLPNQQGDFTLRNLAPGQYRFNARSFAKYWYLQSITLPSVAPAAKTSPVNRLVDAARNWTVLKQGDRISGLTITLAEGAGSFHGQIKIADGQKLAPKLFIYLVPAEREKGEDVLRFFAARVADDGSFALNNIPPGRYWAIAKAAGENESNVLSNLRLPDETETRTKLRVEAELAKTEIELKPCQNVSDYQVPLKSPAQAPDKPPAN